MLTISVYYTVFVTLLCIVILADKVEFKSETQMSELKEKDEEIDTLKLALKEKESKEILICHNGILHSGSFRLYRIK